MVNGSAEVGGILDGLEVVDDAPDDLETIDNPLERVNQFGPRLFDGLLQIDEIAFLQTKEEETDAINE